MKHLTSIGMTLMTCAALQAGASQQTEANVMTEITFQAKKAYTNPFLEATLDVVFTDPGGAEKTVPAFWAGGNEWKVRYASPIVGTHRYRTRCNAADDEGLHGVEGQIEIKPYTGDNPLLKHGFLRVAEDRRHFAHDDGTPFFWLGDTWWKNLCKRLTWEGFQELAADRKAKGFSVVQIVCGPYPDEGPFKPSWENEGGHPYKTQDFTVLNPEYWVYADRRLKHLVDSGIVPAIVGAWGRADCNAMKHVGVEGLKRHWRYLVARYGAFPVFWILGGELHNNAKWGEGTWGEVGRYVRSIDPYQHPLTAHTGGGRRGDANDKHIIDYDMIGGSHNEAVAISSAVNGLIATYAKEPPMPVLVGETLYEGHMQFGFQYVQRHMFWQYMLSGAAGHTYGAAGIWHAGVEGDHGNWGAWGGQPYDWTTWREGMNSLGATQIGLGRKLLEEYPWHRFEPHPEWAEKGSFAAGIPGEVRFIYQPRRSIYNWKGTVVKQLETDIPYRAFYFDPATGRRFDQGIVTVRSGQGAPPGLVASFDGHAKPLIFTDRFGGNAVGLEVAGDASAWKDYGSRTQREGGRLVGSKGMLTIAEKVNGKDLMVSVDAGSNAEAGIVLRFHDPDNYIVAFYSPHFKGLAIHDRRDGAWGEALGMIETPGIGPDFRLTAAVSGEYAALVVTDGKKTWRTPAVRVRNTTPGKAGLWFLQIGEKQAFDNFEVSATTFTPGAPSATEDRKAPTADYAAPNLPSPQDWVLVLEKK